MKKIPLFSAIIMALFTLSSCGDKTVDTPSGETNEKTGLNVVIGFDNAPKTAAPLSNAIPTTSWNANIKSLMLILTQGSGASEVIKDARTVVIPTSASDNVKAFSNITTGTYNVYLVANSAITANTGPYGGAIINKGLVGDAEWSASTLKGLNMANVNLQMKPQGVATNYSSPSEIFIAKSSSAITVISDQMTPVTLNLKRVVSLVRILVNKGTTDNASVDFGSANTEIYLARFQKELNLVSGINTASVPNITDWVYNKGAFNSADPASGYNPNQIISSDFKAWKELLIFPTTNNSAEPNSTLVSNRKIFVKLGAHVPAGYVFLDGSVAPAGGAMAWWAANVDVWFKANQITEVCCTLKSRGEGGDGTTIVPKEEGSMQITVNLLDWDTTIESTPVEM